MDKSDPLNQSTISDQVREQMAKHTLWLNATNFEEMVQASFDGYREQIVNVQGGWVVDPDQWRAYCAAALAVFEWRMGGRVRP